MKDDRKDYMRRLIAEIREDMADDPDIKKYREQFGEDVVTGKWVNISLLCDVVENEVLVEETMSEDQR